MDVSTTNHASLVNASQDFLPFGGNVTASVFSGLLKDIYSDCNFQLARKTAQGK
jgi:hypothetical protein